MSKKYEWAKSFIETYQHERDFLSETSTVDEVREWLRDLAEAIIDDIHGEML